MKKIIINLLLTLSMFTIYSYDFNLQGIKTENNTFTFYRGNSIQTVQNEKFLISMQANNTDEGIQFCTSITNYSGENLFFDDNCIKVYQGDHGTNKWEPIEYLTANEYYKKQKSIATANAIITGISLGLAAANAGYSTYRGSGYYLGYRYTYSARVYNPTEAMIALQNSQIALNNVAQKNGNWLDYLQNNLLYSSDIPAGDNYNGVFYTSKKRGPDYKVVFEITDNDIFEFYFRRDDRDEILNPWKDKRRNRHCVVAGISPIGQHGSLYYEWNRAKGVGVYTGFTLQLETVNKTEKKYKYDYEYTVTYDNSKILKDTFGLIGGITIKTFPNIWLLLGAGIEYGVEKGTYATIYNKSGNKIIKETYLEESCFDINFIPQIGVNFITSFIDLGVMLQYPINGKFSFDIMAGIAF